MERRVKANAVTGAMVELVQCRRILALPLLPVLSPEARRRDQEADRPSSHKAVMKQPLAIAPAAARNEFHIVQGAE